MRMPFCRSSFDSPKKGYHIALAIALLIGVLGVGMLSHSPTASAATVHSSRVSQVHPSLGALQVLMPDNSGGGCQYGSEEITEACVSAGSGHYVVAKGYSEVRMIDCSMDIYVVSADTGDEFGGSYPCSNLVGYVGDATAPAFPGDVFYAYVAMYINGSFWSSATSPEIHFQ